MPRSPSASKTASPPRSDSHAAPIRSSRSSARRHSDLTPSGSGDTSRSSGQRASASPTRIPCTTPNASAAGDTSPTTCRRPASGASATGSPMSSRRPSRAATSANRGNRMQTTISEHMFAYGEAGSMPAAASTCPPTPSPDQAICARSRSRPHIAVRVQGQTRREAGTQSYGGRDRPGRVATRQPPCTKEDCTMPRRLRHKLIDHHGFSLIELLVVMLVIGILAAIALPAFLGQKGKSEDAEAKSNARNLVSLVDACNTGKEDYRQCSDLAGLGNVGIPYGSNPGEAAVTASTRDSYTVTAISKATTGGGHH